MRNSLLGLACAVILLAPPAHGDDGVLIFGATRNTGLEIAKILVGNYQAQPGAGVHRTGYTRGSGRYGRMGL